MPYDRTFRSEIIWPPSWSWPSPEPQQPSLPTATIVRRKPTPPPVEKVVVEMTLKQAKALHKAAGWAGTAMRAIANDGESDFNGLTRGEAIDALGSLYAPLEDALRDLK